MKLLISPAKKDEGGYRYDGTAGAACVSCAGTRTHGMVAKAQKDGKKQLRYITCIFGEECPQADRKGIPVVQKGTFAKMARGEMIRLAAEKQIRTPEGLQRFNRLDYLFRPEYSDTEHYVFTAAKAARTF